MTRREWEPCVSAAGADGGAVIADAYSGLDPSRIAVLCFDDRTDDPELAFVADALTEGLMKELDGVQGLSVVFRSGVLAYRDTDLPADSMGRPFDAGGVVRGEVEEPGGRLRVELALQDPESGVTIDRAGFQRPGHDLLELRTDLVDEVSRVLRTLPGGSRRDVGDV